MPARRADLTGLPPNFISWGEFELFVAEDATYAAALTAADVPVTTGVTSGTPHGFQKWARMTGPARALVERAQKWLGQQIKRAEPSPP